MTGLSSGPCETLCCILGLGKGGGTPILMAFGQLLNILASSYASMANWCFLLSEICKRCNVDGRRAEDCGDRYIKPRKYFCRHMCRSRPSVRDTPDTPAAERRNMWKTPVGVVLEAQVRAQISIILSSIVLILSTCSGLPVHFKVFRMKRRSAGGGDVQDESRHSSSKRVRSQRLENLGRL